MAATMATPSVEAELPAMNKHDLSSDLPTTQVHTPPITDEASHKESDDAASSSSLSELGDDIGDILDDENRMRFEEAARAGAEAEESSETMDEFRDFEKYVQGVNPYGMQSGIVLIDPPEEWKRDRKPLDEQIKNVKIKNPITQEFHGAQGIYTQRNMEKMRSYNIPQWRSLCESTENQPPARRGEKRMNADKLLGRGSVKNKKTEGSPAPSVNGKRRGRPPKNTPVKKEPADESNINAPLTPTSPELQPAEKANAEEEDAEQTPEPTTGKRKPGRKPAAKPRGRQPKSATKRETGGKASETTVAARRLRTAGATVDEIDEEAFRDFDYRVYDNDQWTAERCDELEDKYWKSLNFSNPMYGADMAGSLFDDQTKEWNVAKLPNLLDLIGAPIPGVNTAYLYLGMWRATFAWHLEDVDLYSINYIHFGAPKQWYSISQKDAPKFENAMKSIWGEDAKTCDQFLRHKTYLVSPAILKSKYGVTVNKIVHREGQFIITFPIGYHSGYNLGYNCAESVNFAIPDWLQYGKTARKCQCEGDSVFIDVDWFIRRMNGEPSPEYEEVEITDDEDEDELIDLPTPPGSDRGKIKLSSKRKRATKDVGPNKKARKMIKIRKVSKHQPCCLCPNDFAWEELLPTSNGQKAHRTCAMYTPETYIATVDGKEVISNVENISKARLELKCYECRQKKGSCFQCSSAKCTKSYHATCAMQAGVQVDKGEIAVWHEGVEYRDIGFDWRCRLHRSVKRTRITSELSTCNHLNNCWNKPEFVQYIKSLKAGDLVQWQITHSDEIEAGMIMTGYDEEQEGMLVKVLPDVRVVKEIQPSWILFIDSETSCLQKPSANARDLPEELQGKSAQFPDSERKPSEGDTFTEDPKTEWAEFSSVALPHNKLQKKVDLTKPKQLWLYLGESSTESKAYYTGDPARKIHDPASQYLDTVEPARALMAPPSQPKRQSLAASFPANLQNHTNNGFVRPRTLSGNHSAGPSQNSMLQNGTQAKNIPQAKNVNRKSSQGCDVIIGAEAKANEQARILQRQQAKAQHLDQQAGLNGGIGIDQAAVERQKQFQMNGSQQSQTMWTGYNNTAQYPAYQNAFNAQRQVPQYSQQWMNPMPQMRPGSSHNQHSPHLSQPNGGQFPAYVQQSHQQFPYNSQHQRTQSTPVSDTERIRQETARIESIRAAANRPPPPPPSAAIERQRRISNPAYPFKSPDQILAQKEAEKNTPPGSRPGSSYQMGSPATTDAYRPSTSASMSALGSRPMEFIDPTATQITPPGSSAGRRSASNSLSMMPGTMGPPLQPHLHRTASAGMLERPTFNTSNASQISNYVPRRSVYDPLYKAQGPLQPITQPNLPPPLPQPPMAEPSPVLLASLQPRSTSPGGYPLNDRAVPEQLVKWKAQGGFWAKVATYYINKHVASASAYRSPFADLHNTPWRLAEQYYQSLDFEGRAKVDDYRNNGMRN
ncbi:DNA damage-responsive transcriptional repressor RPH1 [Cyphellophora attinorum]|uniref:[histone H3]-trimethyl-L-lysine(9) demethylase n=1 Tax=Cyphellophora attinorum TaxID=1664694 RepID=A0A0N1H6Q5_9EURO|nr:DNA damage-responsive transcriptional repressor RPH1 [Phialophora attinorum]KPI41813.1 DNA damage-responsive transcriptional repressor RPH1 [Phialophora attinorum]